MIKWDTYQVTLEMQGPFAAAIPRTLEEITAMLEHRMPGKKPVGAVPISELADEVLYEVGAEVGSEDEAPPPGWATFKRDDQGLYYEGRCVRGHLKDCALQIQAFFPTVKNFRAKFVNRVYVMTDKIPLMRGGTQVKEVDGMETRFIQVMTRRGPRSAIKYVDWVGECSIAFTVKVMDDKVITREHLDAVFEYGSIHGMGQERSQGWGRYRVVANTPVL